MKLKVKSLDENPVISFRTLQNNPTKKFSLKRRIVKIIANLEKSKYKPKIESQAEFFQEKIRLFDLKKKITFNFRCFKEEELGYQNEVTKMIIPTRQDNDVETDDETLSYYVKKCQKDLVEAIAAERKNKEEAKEKEGRIVKK